MRTMHGWGLVAGVLWASAGVAAEDWMAPQALLQNAAFKKAYVAALGPRAQERWLATLSNSAPVREVTVAGTVYQVATPCKPHDCADHNLLLLYAPRSGAVYGTLYDAGRRTLIGGPDAPLAAELERLWKQEFRQQ